MSLFFGQMQKTWEFYHIMYSFLIRIDYIYIISGFTPLVVNDKILEGTLYFLLLFKTYSYQ